jgi:hypothetical protein
MPCTVPRDRGAGTEPGDALADVHQQVARLIFESFPGTECCCPTLWTILLRRPAPGSCGDACTISRWPSFASDASASPQPRQLVPGRSARPWRCCVGSRRPRGHLPRCGRGSIPRSRWRLPTHGSLRCRGDPRGDVRAWCAAHAPRANSQPVKPLAGTERGLPELRSVVPWTSQREVVKPSPGMATRVVNMLGFRCRSAHDSYPAS